MSLWLDHPAGSIPCPPFILLFPLMKITLSAFSPAQIETECLAVVALDRGEKDKTDGFVSCADKAVQQAAGEVIASGDVSGKLFEATWLHKAVGLKAKRLLLM